MSQEMETGQARLPAGRLFRRGKLPTNDFTRYGIDAAFFARENFISRARVEEEDFFDPPPMLRTQARLEISKDRSRSFYAGDEWLRDYLKRNDRITIGKDIINAIIKHFRV